MLECPVLSGFQSLRPHARGNWNIGLQVRCCCIPAPPRARELARLNCVNYTVPPAPPRGRGNWLTWGISPRPTNVAPTRAGTGMGGISVLADTGFYTAPVRLFLPCLTGPAPPLQRGLSSIPGGAPVVGICRPDRPGVVVDQAEKAFRNGGSSYRHFSQRLTARPNPPPPSRPRPHRRQP